MEDKNISVPVWVLEKAENTLRLCANTFNSYDKNV